MQEKINSCLFDLNDAIQIVKNYDDNLQFTKKHFEETSEENILDLLENIKHFLEELIIK